jgi:hypothetical protein
MANTPESKVKASVTKVLKQYNVYHFFPPSNGFGRSGIPDIIACCFGRFIAIECKAGKGKATALQLRELSRISNAGGVALIIRENNIDVVEQLFNQMEKDHARENPALPLERPDESLVGEDRFARLP